MVIRLNEKKNTINNSIKFVTHIYNTQYHKLNNMSRFLSKLFPAKDYLKLGEKVICIHKGKYTTYQKYLNINPEIAEKYLYFIGKNPSAVYIRWDEARSQFTS